MKKFVIFFVIAGAVYGYVYYVPAEAKHRALAAAGAADFFQETLPNFLRRKLSIPQSPVAQRKKLLDELSQTIGSIERELEVVAPPRTNGRPGEILKLPAAKEIQERMEKARDFLAQSESVLEELQKANPQSGILQKAAERILDKILPEPSGADENTGLGGDSSGGQECKLVCSRD